jgi:hypothetical protein
VLGHLTTPKHEANAAVVDSLACPTSLPFDSPSPPSSWNRDQTWVRLLPLASAVDNGGEAGQDIV